MGKIKALVFAQVNRDILQQRCPDVAFTYAGYSENYIVLDTPQLIDLVSGYEIIISEFETIDKSVIDAADNLKLLICCRGGMSTVVDIDYAEQNGILVRNTPGRNSNAVAEYVIGQIINVDRKLALSNMRVQDGTLEQNTYFKPKGYGDSLWGMDKKSPYHTFRGRGLENITLGIVGYGRVGRIVCEKARLLGIKVLVYDHSVSEVTPELEVVDFSTLLRKADVVSLHCSNYEHKVIMGQNEFSLMKKGSYFINTARGDLVDEEALINAVKSGHLGQAIIDVTQEEPLPIDSPLIGVDGLQITPHIAGATDMVIDNVSRIVVAHIKNYLEAK
ncbi:MAG: hypothetical protein K5868_05010 [Lachnospiraceae bacterium]|nr:hypothetical protein [Lachnospiraceae bacterium]